MQLHNWHSVGLILLENVNFSCPVSSFMAWGMVVGGDCSAGPAQCLPLRQVQRGFWEAVCQSRLFGCPVLRLYDLKLPECVGGWLEADVLHF